jgi:lipopolysaccharide exporter
MASEFGRSIATGAAWMVGLRFGHRLVGLVSITFLARLLTPQDFGVVALATTVVGFLDLFGQTQVDLALIRDQGTDRKLYDSAWTLDILRGAAVTLVLVVIGAPAAAFFSEPRVEAVLYAVAAIQLVASFQNIGTVEFRKRLRFGRDFVFELSCRVAGAALTIAAAYFLRNHWTLVLGIALQTCSRVALSYVLSDYRPRMSFARFREIFHFSKWVVFQNLFYGLREQAPVFTVSRLLNFEAVGIFNVAREISAFVTTELRSPIRRALYPGFARLSLETGALKAGYIDAFAIMLLLSLPMSAGLYIVAPLLVEVILGPGWLSAVPLLEVLAFLGIIQSFGANTPLVLNRIGKPKVNAIAGGVHFIVFVPALLWSTARFGIIGAAWSIVISSGALLIAEYAIMYRVLSVRLSEMFAQAWRPMLAAVCMTWALIIIRNNLGEPAGGFALLVLLVLFVFGGAIIYGAILLAAWKLSGARPGAERHMLQVIGHLIGRILPPSLARSLVLK